MAMPSLSKPLVLEWARRERIEKSKNVIVLGTLGVSKTHTTLALGLASYQKRHNVACITTAALLNELMEVRDEKRLRSLQKKLINIKSLIVD